MIYFSLARETTTLLCYTIFHTLIDKRRKEISLFSILQIQLVRNLSLISIYRVKEKLKQLCR